MTVEYDQSNSQCQIEVQGVPVQILAEDWLSWFPSVTASKCSHITL